MNLEPGKLYKVNRYFWYLLPTKEAAAPRTPGAAEVSAAISLTNVASWISYWSKQLSCNVSFIGEGDTVMIVEASGIQVKVINQEGNSGWINFPADVPVHVPTLVEVTNRAHAQKKPHYLSTGCQGKQTKRVMHKKMIESTHHSAPLAYCNMYVTPTWHFGSVQEARGALRALYYCCVPMSYNPPGSVDMAFYDELNAAETFEDVSELFAGWFIVTAPTPDSNDQHHTAKFRVGGRVRPRPTPGSQATQPPVLSPIFSGTGS